MQFQRISASTRQGRLTEIPRERVVSKVQVFKGKYNAELEFLEGWCVGGGGGEGSN